MNGLLGVRKFDMFPVWEGNDPYLPELTHKLISRKNGPEGSDGSHVTLEKNFPIGKSLYW